ncbi:MAG: GNAT family N-acetyltransferase [Alphaproteobacteria bacterium]
MTIRLQTSGDAAQIEALLDRAFGPDRKKKSSYRLRDGVPAIPSLSFVNVLDDGRITATLRFWPIAIGEERIPALLLGPLAVEPGMQGLGFGKALMRHGLEMARAEGHAIVVLVGDPDYYRPFGFSRALTRDLAMPGPTDPERFLALELEPGALEGIAGLVGKAPAKRRAAPQAAATFAFAEP